MIDKEHGPKMGLYPIWRDTLRRWKTVEGRTGTD